MRSSTVMPSRRMISNCSTCVPMPTPRLARSPLLRSNTATSQPDCRKSSPANSPPSEPPMTSARPIAIILIAWTEDSSVVPARVSGNFFAIPHMSIFRG
jgi:hypothetical protein